MYLRVNILFMSVSYMAIVAYTKGKLSTPAASPFGLSFGPTVITASRYNESGLVEVTEQTTSTEYQQLFQAAVQDFGVTYHDTQYEGPKHEQAKMVFTGSSQSMTRQLKSQLGYEPEFAALIHATVMQGWLSHAAQTAIFGLHAPPTVTYGGSQKAAVQIVDFLQCEHLNRSLEECSSRGPENSLLFLEYQDDYLYAWFYDVDFEQDFYAHYYREICKDCGERFRERDGVQVYDERLTHFFEGMVKKIDDMDWYDRQSLRALLIGGESSVGGLTRLAHIAMKAVAVKHMQHIVDLEPSLIIPYGAAWWAWDSKLSPVVVHTGNRVQDYPSSPEPEHKEL